MYQHLVVYQNGSLTVFPDDANQPVQGNGRYVVPNRYGGMVQRVVLQSSEGSNSTIWDAKWVTPWQGSI